MQLYDGAGEVPSPHEIARGLGGHVRQGGSIAVDFLRRFHPSTSWALATFGPGDNEIGPARTFAPTEAEAARQFIEEQQGRHNLYFTVNAVVGKPTKKPSKRDIAEIHWLHVDADLSKTLDWSDPSAVATEQRKMLERLRTYIPPPTAIVWSGGGYQAFWRLSEILVVNGAKEMMAAVERRMRRIEKALGADACHNADRIMRLPGTVNVLGSTKIRAGRKPALAELIEFHDDRIHDLEDFPELEASRVANGALDRPEAENLERTRQALRFIPADDYDVYLRIGMALKAELGDAGFALYREWAQASIKFDDAEIRRKWTSMAPQGGVTIATLFGLARDRGWREEHRTGNRAASADAQQRGRRDVKRKLNGPANGESKAGAGKTAITDDGETIGRLAALSLVEYDRQREAAAERLGCRTTILDAAVKTARAASHNSGGQGQPLALFEPAPWDDRVEGPDLLDGLANAISRHVILAEHAADAIALWVVHAHVFDAFTVTPRLGITSAEKRCGKTTLLDVLVCLVPRPLLASNISAAATYRTIEFARPTLLVDEADTFLSDNEDLRGVLNSGHRKGGSVVRLVGDKHEPRRFATYAPVAIALIGALPGTLADRSIPIRMQRRRADEKVTLFRGDRTEGLARFASMAARWAADNRERLAEADPDTDGLFNRDADNWRSLLAIADAAGGDWPARARAVAKVLTAAGAEDHESMGTMVLADIRAVFENRGADRLTSKEIVEHLHSLEERPWLEFGRRRKPMTQNALARLLKRFGIMPSNMRANGRSPQKGYVQVAFQDAFERYLAPAEGLSSAKPKHDKEDQGVMSDFNPLHRAGV